MANIDKSKNEFCIVFKVGPNVTFEVSYYRCGDNKAPYFTTSASIWFSNHRGVLGGGQCQERALKDSPLFYNFYKKWDPHHLHKLTPNQLMELASDVKALKNSGAPFFEASDGDYEDRCSNMETRVLGWKPHKAYRIKWDTDGASLKECGLPTSTIVPFGMDEDEVFDWLSDTYGFCHDGFRTNFTTKENCEK